MSNRILYVLIFIFLVAKFSYPQLPFAFQTINKDDGLTDNYVNCILEDSRGFMWFGTKEGLCRYDGNSFVHYKMPDNPFITIPGISRNFINALIEDSNKNIWIGTLAGIYLFNIETYKYTYLDFFVDFTLPFERNFIEQILFDSLGNAWIASRSGLTYLDIKNKRCRNYFQDTTIRNSLPNNYIHSINFDYEGYLWVGTRNGGLCRYNKNTNGFDLFTTSPNGVPDLNIRSIFEDSQNNLWVLTAQKGLFKRPFGSQSFSYIPLKVNVQNNFTILFQHLNEDKHGNIWISTQTDGLLVYNPQTSTTTHYTENTVSDKKISSNSIESIFRDNNENMWLATQGGGVCMYSPMLSWFEHYEKSNTHTGLQGNIVSAFCEDHKGIIWIATDGNGFCRFDRKTRNFTFYTKSDGLSSNSVLDIEEIEDNILAIATYTGGLNIFNTITKQFKQYLFQNNRNDKDIQHIYDLFYEKEKKLLWCNTFGDGIQIFDCNKRVFLSDSERKKINQHFDNCVFVNKTVIDKEKNIWVIDYRLFKFKDNTVKDYSTFDSTGVQVGVNFPTDILINKNNRIWVSSYFGVFRYDRKADNFIKIEDDNQFTEARSLLEDKWGNVWVATLNSLFKYNTKTRQIQNITQQWGIPEMQYFRKSTLRTQNGDLFIGGLKGFITIHEDYSPLLVEPTLCLTKLLINQKEQIPGNPGALIKKDISYLNELTLPYNQNFITIEFAAFNYVDNKKSKFMYKLDGLNDTWIQVEKDRKAIFTDLSPGNYTFFLKTTDSNGKWINKPLKMKITILPPWWQTWWFKLLFICIIMVSIFSFIRIRIHKIKHEKEALEAIVEKRTKELIEKNHNLELHRQTIQNQYEEIKENNFVIELKKNQLQEALDMKDKLITVIAHDFKNPLTALQGNLKLIKRKLMENTKEDLSTSLDATIATTNTITQEMLTLLDWSMSNDKTVVCVPTHINLELLIAENLTLINDLAYKKDITIHKETSCEFTAFADPRMINAVLRNILINSIKYNKQNGSIWIKLYHTQESVILEIEDTGIGIDKKIIDAIIQSNTVTNKQFEYGFGLMICKNFIFRNQGTFSIESTLNKGSIFKIGLPKGEPIKTKKEITDEEAISVYPNNVELTLLVIDDNKDIAHYLCVEFSDYFSVYEANDAEKGLSTAYNIVPDIILCDVSLPNMNGLNFCQSIKSNPLTCHIPIILISAKSSPEEQIRGLQAGAEDYITKPFDISILKSKVYSLVKNRQLIQANKPNEFNKTQDFQLPQSYDDKLIDQARKIIIENMSDPNFSVEVLARMLNLSRSQLYKKFVVVLGQTPKEFLISLKFEKAIKMLKTKKYRVSDIAFELGFSDPHYFSTIFTQRYGVSPTQYNEK
ncbi:MAG: two-component regulator propeller domain-containing protein [Bacteroidales bacterium]